MMENRDEKLNEVLSIFENAKSRLEILEKQYEHGVSDEEDFIGLFIWLATNVALIANYIQCKKEKVRKQEEFKQYHD